MNFFKMFFPKKIIGIDIGTSSLKVVEISHWGGGKTLENYGEIKLDSLYKESSTQDRNSYLLSSDFISKAIKLILSEAKIKTKEAIFSIPDFSTFCTLFDIPPMPEKEIADAIRFNASQYIPLPISEVTLDWKILPNVPGSKQISQKVFLVAVPNQVIQDYQTISKLAGLELYALEAEAMGIARSLVKDTNKVVCLVDIGIQSSTINIVDKGFLKRSYSFNFNSSQLSSVISSTLGVQLPQAEDIKSKEGLLHPREDVVKTLYLLLDPLLLEIKNICAEFNQLEQRQVQEVYLTGGTANLPGLKEYVAKNLATSVSVPNCFSEFLYPPILEDSLRKMSPSFSVAVGVALGGLET